MSTARFTVKKVKATIEKLGLRVIGTSEPDSEVDGEVSLEEGIHIQVGDTYLHVNKENADGSFYFDSNEIKSYAQLQKQFRKLDYL